MKVVYFVLLIPSILLGCYVKVNAVEIPQYWINYIATLLRKYDFLAAGKGDVLNNCCIVLL